MRSFVDIIVMLVTIIIIGILILTLVAAIVGFVDNESNEISEGVIVDKDFYPGGLRTTGKVMYHEKDRWQFTIEGEKDGKTVEYFFYVSQDEYESYQIGDYYRR